MANVFGSTQCLTAFLQGVKQQDKRIRELETNQEEPTGKLNCDEEKRRIQLLITSADGNTLTDLQARQNFLHLRFYSQSHGRNNNARMGKAELEAECVQELSIAPKGQRGKGQGLGSICKHTTNPRKGDLVWALYRAQRREFDGSQRVQHSHAVGGSTSGGAEGSSTSAAAAAASTSAVGKQRAGAVAKQPVAKGGRGKSEEDEETAKAIAASLGAAPAAASAHALGKRKASTAASPQATGQSPGRRPGSTSRGSVSKWKCLNCDNVVGTSARSCAYCKNGGRVALVEDVQN